MKKIDISTPKFPNTFALVNDEDFNWLNQWKWHPVPNRTKTSLYVDRRDSKTQKLIKMHQEIMKLCKNKEQEIDHINGNGLDNQRFNLRLCSHAQNCQNRRMATNNSSGFKGVCWDKFTNRWKAQIKSNGRVKNLGRFFCIVKAAKAYDTAAIKLFGEFACLNWMESK